MLTTASDAIGHYLLAMMSSNVSEYYVLKEYNRADYPWSILLFYFCNSHHYEIDSNWKKCQIDFMLHNLGVVNDSTESQSVKMP